MSTPPLLRLTMSVLVSQLRGRDPTRWAPRKVTREEFHFVRIRPHFFDLFKCPVCSDLLASDFGLLHVFQHQYAINLEHLARMDAQEDQPLGVELWNTWNGICRSCGRIKRHWHCSLCGEEGAHPCRAPGCPEEVCSVCGHRWVRGLNGDLFQHNRRAQIESKAPPPVQPLRGAPIKAAPVAPCQPRETLQSQPTACPSPDMRDQQRKPTPIKAAPAAPCPPPITFQPNPKGCPTPPEAAGQVVGEPPAAATPAKAALSSQDVPASGNLKDIRGSPFVRVFRGSSAAFRDQWNAVLAQRQRLRGRWLRCANHPSSAGSCKLKWKGGLKETSAHELRFISQANQCEEAKGHVALILAPPGLYSPGDNEADFTEILEALGGFTEPDEDPRWFCFVEGCTGATVGLCVECNAQSCCAHGRPSECFLFWHCGDCLRSVRWRP